MYTSLQRQIPFWMSILICRRRNSHNDPRTRSNHRICRRTLWWKCVKSHNTYYRYNIRIKNESVLCSKSPWLILNYLQEVYHWTFFPFYTKLAKLAFLYNAQWNKLHKKQIQCKFKVVMVHWITIQKWQLSVLREKSIWCLTRTCKQNTTMLHMVWWKKLRHW